MCRALGNMITQSSLVYVCIHIQAHTGMWGLSLGMVAGCSSVECSHVCEFSSQACAKQSSAKVAADSPRPSFLQAPYLLLSLPSLNSYLSVSTEVPGL